uniref:UPF0506 domain-containing protein n=1 Tax=Anopheles quadriannulatus TaxID=34691 RepID=A0A182XPJ2_ANOQN
SCLSFSYKCVPVPASASEGFISVPVKPVPIDTANRFGADDGGASLTQKTCALNGEYCLTSSECCSKSCLSFAYKCVNRYDLSVVADPNLPVTSIYTSNRFGGTVDETSTGTPKCTSNGLYCVHNKDCCSGACYKSVCSTEIRVGVLESELTRPSVINGPYIQVQNLDDLITRYSGQISTTEQSVTHIEGRCKAIGDSVSS